MRERDWTQQSDGGLLLTDPDGLPDEWSRNYEPPKGEEVRLYTHLHGKALTERLREIPAEEGNPVLASFSAAHWLAPFGTGRTPTLKQHQAMPRRFALAC